MSNALSFSIHGTWLTLESNNADFLAYTGEHLAALASPKVGVPEIQVRLQWGQELMPVQASINGYHRLGQRFLMGDHEIIQTQVLTLPGLQLRTSLSATNISMEAAFQPHSKRKLIPGWGGKPSQQQIFAALIGHLVYFPLLWHIERTREWYPIHASAVAWPQGAVLLSGLEGVGTTTLTLAFLSDPNARLLSQNLILHDKTQVYAFPEPIHLDDQSLKLLGGLNGRLKPTGRAISRHRKRYEVSVSDRVLSAVPRLLFTLRQGKGLGLRLMSVQEALEVLLSSDVLVKELNEYEQQAAALNLLSPRAGSLQQRAETLGKLLKQVTCYELTFKPADDLRGTTALVRGRLGW